MSDRTRRIVGVLLAELHRLLDGFGPLIAECSQREPSPIERAALGAMLHGFYQGVEGICTRISADVDHVLPGGEQWHRDLLYAMTQATARRPAVFSQALHQRLAEYLGFRHLFRNISLLDLDWARMAPLVARVPETLEHLEAELDAFFALPYR